jgi:hypothetical protein
VPAGKIGDRLAAIQKNHPREYENGMQMVISPPVRGYPYPMPPSNEVANPGMPPATK